VYLEHFGLRELPFTLSPNTEFFMELEGHREAMALIIQALQEGRGHVQIIGEVGTGKTLLCRRLLQIFDEQFLFAYIPNPFLSPEGLALALIRELGEVPPADADLPQLRVILHNRLQALRASGRKTVLLLDDVQAMPEATLHALLSLATGKEPYFPQIIFVGQPELNDLLNRDSLQMLSARIGYRISLPTLDGEETGRYIRHRLRTAGFPGANLFTPTAIEEIGKAGKGNPRIINILGHKALLSSYSRRDTSVNYQHVLRAIEETDDAVPVHGDATSDTLACNWRTMLLACMGVSAMTLTLVWALIIR
jgi:MSHA biogenesis protein MshM